MYALPYIPYFYSSGKSKSWYSCLLLLFSSTSSHQIIKSMTKLSTFFYSDTSAISLIFCNCALFGDIFEDKFRQIVERHGGGDKFREKNERLSRPWLLFYCGLLDAAICLQRHSFFIRFSSGQSIGHEFCRRLMLQNIDLTNSLWFEENLFVKNLGHCFVKENLILTDMLIFN